MDKIVPLYGEWISVRDRLPMKQGVYITVCKVGGIRRFHLMEFWKDAQTWMNLDGAISKRTHVTHWMPLPAPPDD